MLKSPAKWEVVTQFASIMMSTKKEAKWKRETVATGSSFIASLEEREDNKNPSVNKIRFFVRERVRGTVLSLRLKYAQEHSMYIHYL